MMIKRVSLAHAFYVVDIYNLYIRISKYLICFELFDTIFENIFKSDFKSPEFCEKLEILG